MHSLRLPSLASMQTFGPLGDLVGWCLGVGLNEGSWFGWSCPVVGDQVGTSVELGAKLLLGAGLGQSLGASVRINVGSFVGLGAKL